MKPKVMLEESMKPPSTENRSFEPEIIHSYGRGRVKYKEI